MKPRKARLVTAGLERKGFVKSSSDHDYWTLHIHGHKTSIRAKISHGETECDSFVLGEIAKALKLSSSDLGRLLDCPLSYDAYVALLVQRGHVSA